jgi:chromosome segregation ATPase
MLEHASSERAAAGEGRAAERRAHAALEEWSRAAAARLSWYEQAVHTANTTAEDAVAVEQQLREHNSQLSAHIEEVTARLATAEAGADTLRSELRRSRASEREASRTAKAAIESAGEAIRAEALRAVEAHAALAEVQGHARALSSGATRARSPHTQDDGHGVVPLRTMGSSATRAPHVDLLEVAADTSADDVWLRQALDGVSRRVLGGHA